jgi:hypothetical protein
MVNLPRFKKELAKHAKSLPSGTYWRYSNGMLPPPLGMLLVNNPDLAEALAEDARALGRENGTVAQAGESSYTKSGVTEEWHAQVDAYIEEVDALYPDNEEYVDDESDIIDI